MKSIMVALAAKKKAQKKAFGGRIEDDFLTADMESPFEDEELNEQKDEFLTSPPQEEISIEMDNQQGNSLLESIMRKIRRSHGMGK